LVRGHEDARRIVRAIPSSAHQHFELDRTSRVGIDIWS
jgi:hypothetical protein